MHKMVIAVRSDLKMSRGKLAAQCCHAAVSVLDEADKKLVAHWKSEGQKKIVVKAKSEQQLLELAKRAKKLSVPFCFISDAGLTELVPGTLTTLAVGPEKGEKVDKITGSLPLLK